MRQATIRWMIFLSALLAVGPAAGWLLKPLRAIDGSAHATPLLSAAPAAGLLRGLAAAAIALGMGLLACRIAGFRSALSTTGIVLAWIAWRTADVDQLVRTAHSASPFATLAIEGAIFGLVAVAIAAALALTGRIAEPAEQGDIGEGPIVRRLLGGTSALLMIGAGVVAGGLAAWAIAHTPVKGQALAGAVFGGIAIAAVGRLIDYRLPLAGMMVPAAILAALGPLSATVLATPAGVVADAYRGTLAPLAHVTPLDWVAGAFLGIPLGAAWVTSMVEKRVNA